MELNIKAGLIGEKQEQVTNENTAVKYGSGDVPVFATPALVGLMEGAAIKAVDAFLPPGFCTVGTKVNITHSAATPVGMTVTCKAELTEVEGRRLLFHVQGFDGKESVGEGTHERFIVDKEKFEARALSRGDTL